MTSGAGMIGGAVAPVGGEVASSAVYRPHVDGLRALAVYLVVLFHAGSGEFPGGFVGVDVFFVLSGFLVTQLLLRDIEGRGSIRFGRFYARRFRRLLPAAFVTLIVTAVVFSAIASPVEIANMVGSFKAAFLYCTNWYFIGQATNYFGTGLATNPVLQFWSLAVEEQFYLVWPVLLGGAFWWTRRLGAARRMFVIRVGIAVAAVASAVWALSLQGSNPNRAYYGTDARAYQLLAGALLALFPAFVVGAARFRRSMHVATVASVAGIVVLASSLVHVNAIGRGIAVTVVTCVMIVAIEAVDGGPVKGLLSLPPVVYLGRISYGTYLWHWLVILFVARQLHLSTLSTIAIACTVATAFASLSYELLERPVRVSTLLDGHRRVVIASGLALSVVSAVVFIPKIMNPANAEPTTAGGTPATGFTPIPTGLDLVNAADGYHTQDCFRKPVSACTVVKGTGQSILLIGDSHAAMLIPTFTKIAHDDNLTFSVTARGLCPWQQNLFVKGADLAAPPGSAPDDLTAQGCRQVRDDLYERVIPELHPDIIVGAAYEDAYPDPEQSTAATLEQLTRTGAKVVLIEDFPVAPSDPRTCLSQAKVLEECRYVANEKPKPLELLYRKLDAEHADVYSADFDHFVCPFLPICDPVIDGQMVKFDPTHLTVAYAESIAPQIEDYLEQTVISQSG